MVASKQYYRGNSIASLGTTGSLRESVFNAFLDIKRKIRLPQTVSDYVENSFDFALASMFPMIVNENNSLYYTHPLLLGFLKKWNLFSSDEKSNKEIMVKLLRLLEKVQEGTYMRPFLSEEAEFFHKKGIQKLQFINDLTRLSRLIKMTKLIDSTWNESPSYRS